MFSRFIMHVKHVGSCNENILKTQNRFLLDFLEMPSIMSVSFPCKSYYLFFIFFKSGIMQGASIIFCKDYGEKNLQKLSFDLNNPYSLTWCFCHFLNLHLITTFHSIRYAKICVEGTLACFDVDLAQMQSKMIDVDWCSKPTNHTHKLSRMNKLIQWT